MAKGKELNLLLLDSEESEREISIETAVSNLQYVSNNSSIYSLEPINS